MCEFVGIAWFDEQPPPMDEVTLRSGGLPLMGPATSWPSCTTCGVPMLFRAQLPLAISGLARHDDDRVVLVFECHAWANGQPCAQGKVVVARGEVAPRLPPSLNGTSGTHEFAVLAPRGGKLVPFDDAIPGTHRTTLPPLESLEGTPRHGRLLGLLGGTTPGSIDGATLCGCGRPTRTVMRLLALDEPVRPRVCLGPALVQLCLRCDVGRVHRMVFPCA